jgi:hypothetical protein
MKPHSLEKKRFWEWGWDFNFTLARQVLAKQAL